MRLFIAGALAAVLATVNQPRLASAAMDGRVTREEALRIVQTPLAEAIGRAEAERVKEVALANAILEHCRLDWNWSFRALTHHHRHVRGRPETEMSRITVWHGAWQARALDMLRREKPACDDTMRRAAIDNAARHLKALAAPEGS